MVKIKAEKLNELYNALSADMTVYIPVETKNGVRFTRWSGGEETDGEPSLTKSVKELFFPQTESLMEFKTEGKRIEITESEHDNGEFILFGARGCDVGGLAVLDRVFLKAPADTFYKGRRDSATVVSFACTRPQETCFCFTFGIDAADPDGDVVAINADDEVFMTAKTEKGTKLLERISHLTEETDGVSAQRIRELIRERLNRLPLAGLSADKLGDGKTSELFDSPEWQSLSEMCLGCGACTFVCPTCQCYDIKDFCTGNGVIRFRCWDSCMYSEFTKMSAGQPRLTQLERFRQRFMHKLVYFPTENDGMFSCVGCGRCISACPIKMNIVKVMKKLGGTGSE